MFPILPTTLRLALASLLWIKEPDTTPDRSSPIQFQLRHQHAMSNTSRIVFSDIPSSQSLAASEIYALDTRTIDTHRPSSMTTFSSARMRSMRHMQDELQPLTWDEIPVAGPDVEKRETLLQLAKMTYDAYYEPGDKDWYDLGPDWNTTYPFGWEPDADGFRGHIFVSQDNATVVVSVKGTTGPWIAGGGGPTTKKDKLNDNLLFSCCCAKVGPTWSAVCPCHAGGYKCDQTCLEESLIEDSLFYSVGVNLYNNVTYMYPDANIWLIGHSLGGSLASLLGATFGAPVVAFEAPGDKLPAARLHLPSPPSTQHITHVYHTGDPIPMGVCTGVTSPCAIGGYALESRCHLGKTILYDTVSQLGWSVSARTHGIEVVVQRLLSVEWGPSVSEGREVPEAKPETDCVDCFSWEFGDYKNTSGSFGEL